MNTTAYVSVNVPNWNMFKVVLPTLLATLLITLVITVASLVPVIFLALLSVPEYYIWLLTVAVFAPIVEELAKTIIISRGKTIWIISLLGFVMIEMLLYVHIGQSWQSRLLPVCMHLSTIYVIWTYIVKANPIKGFVIGVIIHASFNIGAVIIATY